MIEVLDVTRVYQMGLVEVQALRGVRCSIQQGEFVGIMGPSGSGKSTLLHILGLLDSPTSGTVTIDGTDVGLLKEQEKSEFRLNHLGYVFQDYALVPELSVRENVVLPAMARGAPPDTYLKESEEILRQVGLGHRIDHRQYELSGGEQQRVAIARALINRPGILFADEPCANLDSNTSRTILNLFRELNEKYGQTIIMVTHEEWHEEFMCRVLYMKDGLIDGEKACKMRENKN
ncbi:ABC transporter ATP-binding protein [Methanospirillum stamsii]|uniref:ABC transporter n=1 Tax=Methanospirillum stamsii TaxID=1277351 RepID=A0A2V2NAD4_9EURY|nr:ABC transporter ATP-binding protein [Methanospirillum stamsii]PWR74596.1 ABC transporter [Methanospirillum stamsii]